MGNLPSSIVLWEGCVSIPEDAAQPRFLLKYDSFCPTGSESFHWDRLARLKEKVGGGRCVKRMHEKFVQKPQISGPAAYNLPAVKLFSK